MRVSEMVSKYGPRTTQEELVNKFKAVGTTITNILPWIEIHQRPKGPPAKEGICTGLFKVF